MDIQSLRQRLVSLAERHQTKTDPSHDLQHILRVMHLAERIAVSIGADLEVVLPAACFHDVVVYPKNSPQNNHATHDSAELAKELLLAMPDFPLEKINLIQTCIQQCSFSKGIIPESIESKALQDADRLESIGAIAIMRLFSSGGQMQRQFYRPEDPCCDRSEPIMNASDIDVFCARLLRIEATLHTDLAKQMAKRRTEFLDVFLAELRSELHEAGVV